MKSWLLHKLNLGEEALTELVQVHYNTVGAKDEILSQDEYGNWTFDGKQLTDLEIKTLKEEAQAITKSKIWKVIMKDLDAQASKRMVEASSLMQLESAKLFLFVIDIFKTRVRRISQSRTL